MDILSDTLFEQPNVIPAYNATASDELKMSYMDTRFMEMQQARTVVDRDWATYQQMIEARYRSYEDERSSSIVPLISSMIELYVAEASKIPTEFNFKAETSEYETNAQALEAVWKYDWRINNRERVFDEAEYIAAGFGISVIKTGYESYERTQSDFVLNDDMTYTWTPNTFKDEKITTENVDIRNFYIDNQAISSFEQANDCVLRTRIGWDNFQCFKGNPLYKNLDKVQPKNFSTDYQTFFTREDAVRQGKFVEIRQYWNVEKDVYMVSANGVLIREHPMVSTIAGKKALPFVVRTFGKKNYSIYGRGFCEAGMMFNSELNNLRELLMDAIKRSNSQTLALGNGISFNGRDFSYDNEILVFDGKLDDSTFKQISGNPPNQAIFGYIDRLYKDIAVYIGIDIQNIIGDPQQTAFQTEVQREASQKRVNVWLKNRGIAYERYANLMKDLLQIYFPRKTAEGLVPELQIEGKKLIGTGGKQKFKPYKGKSIFKVTPEILRGEIYIDVSTDTTTNTINAVDKENKIRFMTALGLVLQGYELAGKIGFDLNSVLPLKTTIRDLAKDCNLDVPSDSSGDDAAQDMLKQAQQQVQQMKDTTTVPATGVSQEPTPPAAPALTPSTQPGA